MGASAISEADRRNWHRIEELFHQAEALPPGRRKEFLERASGGDTTLKERVEALLEAEVDEVDEVGALLEPVAPGPSALLSPEADPRAESAFPTAPDRVGPYGILREVGRGGLSSVFLAERADGTFRKHVALKLVRRGLDTRDILDRLRQERQILARLDHPNIARLLDGGSTEDGRPYFVMEYVEGRPIDDYCRAQRLGLRERLELFRTVCSAVHYAHRNLTIHRDIKPSNILVTQDGTPKLLDFGIAKVLESDPGETTWKLTRPGLRFMTPAYASPEQIRGEALSTATDVYTLGILLFRLVTGAPPFELEGLAFHQLEKVICEVSAPRASQRLTEESMASVGLGGSSRRRLASRLEGDLETILAKTLRKEPERRYGSVLQLSEDIRCHLEGLPVEARPDHWGYRTRKFVRRHWRPLSAALIMVVTLAAVVSYYSLRLVQERDRALKAFARAELESSKSSRVTDFLQQIFEVSDPSRSRGESVTALQLLDRGAQQIERELAEEPEIQASLMEAISQSYAGLGLFEEAEEQLESSFHLRQDLFQDPHPALASSHEKLGELRISQGRYGEAQEHLAEAFEQRREILGADDPKTAESLGDLGALAHMLGRLDEAEKRYLGALEVLEDRPGPRGVETLKVQGNLVTLYYNQGRLEEAEALARRVFVTQREVLGQDHPDSMRTEGKLAGILLRSAEYEAAEGMYRRLWEKQRELLGEEHPTFAVASTNLATALYLLRRYDEAAPLYRKALEIQREAHGERQRNTLRTMINLANVEAEGFGNDALARTLYERALELWLSLVGDASAELLTPLIKLGTLELRQGRPEVAEGWLRKALEILEEDLSRPYPQQERWRVAETRSLLGVARLRQKDLRSARSLLTGALEELRRELEAENPKLRQAERRVRELEAAEEAAAGC